MKPREANTWVPLTLQAQSEELPIVSRASGEFFFDQENRRYIDGISSWWTAIHGHRHPRIMEAICKQTEKLDHFMLGGFLNEEAEALSERLIRLSEFLFQKVFYSDNGSNAVEIALKLSVQYFENLGQAEANSRKSFVIFSHSYHGDSIGAMSVSGESYFNRIFQKLQFPVKSFPAPDCRNCPFFKKPKDCNVECLDAVESLWHTNAKDYAGVVVEPLVFGAGGMKMYEPKVLRRLQNLARKFQILTIYDEVFTGLGKTGSLFGYQNSETVPDFLCIAKGLTGGSLPLAATLVSPSVYEAFVSIDPYKSFFHAHTMAGNSLACAAGIASLEVLLEETFPLVAKQEQFWEQFANRLAHQQSGIVKNPRCLGNIFAFELQGGLVAEDEYLKPLGKRFARALWEQGVFLRPLGDTVYVVLPYNSQISTLEKVAHEIERCVPLVF